MFGGNVNIPAFALGGTLLGVGGSDGDCGTTETNNTNYFRMDGKQCNLVTA